VNITVIKAHSEPGSPVIISGGGNKPSRAGLTQIGNSRITNATTSGIIKPYRMSFLLNGSVDIGFHLFTITVGHVNKFNAKKRKRKPETSKNRLFFGIKKLKKRKVRRLKKVFY
jgi:hypothetical protein